MTLLGVRRSDCARARAGRGLLEAGLGKLVQFDKRGHHLRARPIGRGTAQIILFNGVRYERDGTPIPARPVASPRPKRKRV